MLLPAQVSYQRAAIKLGMPGVEVRKILGTPETYRDARVKRSVSKATVGEIPPSTVYQDIYEFQTPINSYELNIEYGSDNSESRLHPTPRVIRALFDLDKRMNVSDFHKLLEDLPEAAAFCGSECTVAISTQADDLYLHPKSLTLAELTEAERIGTIFGMFPARGRKPTLNLVLERGLIVKVMLSEDECVFEGPVTASWKPQRATP
jgi:hypothetical protein